MNGLDAWITDTSELERGMDAAEAEREAAEAAIELLLTDLKTIRWDDSFPRRLRWALKADREEFGGYYRAGLEAGFRAAWGRRHVKGTECRSAPSLIPHTAA